MSEQSTVKTLKPYHQVSLDKAVIKVGAKWCKACKESKEEYEKLAKKYKDVTFYDADSDRFDKEKSEMKEIRKIIGKTKALPTFYFFRKGKLVYTMEGLNKEKFKTYLKNL